MAQREPLYLEVADIIVDTNRRNPRSVSGEIVRQIRRRERAGAEAVAAREKDSGEKASKGKP